MFLSLKNYKWHIFAGVTAIVVIFFSWTFFNQEEEQGEDLFADLSKTEDIQSQVEEVSHAPVEPQEVKVDVKGAVLSPGLYSALQGERVYDLIQKAGGFTEEADGNRVNLAQIVEDQMVIYVPVIGEEGDNALEQNSVGNSSTGGGEEGQKVNLNNADENELQTLPGIGPSKAEAIIQYRSENGPFQSIEDLKNVSGIGEKTFEKLKENIAI
ncbi:helix-hairpin-helix domain-containing protein [Bacillus sp. AGMB 02131]|uniref:Helix-hairpin-helix domain-containing protein n=1 Tax=Peribacillus faecalis TaxID=2772559 RepID=A0A927CYH2_9BACI|nr:helix-hairpin-helix domain-containing protein [Peribacillus faecalis]